MNVLAVGLGGAIGAVLRYLLGQAIPRLAGVFPLGTFCVNIVGCFAIGVIVALAGRNSGIDPRLVLFLQTGICGGFTTFSTFSLETVSLMDEGKIPLALLYLCASVMLGIGALLTARYMVQAWE
ncbi:MAG: fluoride efflux transporter CrcB [Selenomonas artemidis]|nr:fluoride efflux transporter CrcB [Selenomonas artemidis]